MSCAEACWRKIGVRFHVTVVTKNVLSKFIPEPYRPAHTDSLILEQKSMARSRMDRFCSKAAASTWKSGSHAEEAVLYERAALCGRASLERLCVEEHLFRADVEERLFRAASACA